MMSNHDGSSSTVPQLFFYEHRRADEGLRRAVKIDDQTLLFDYDAVWADPRLRHYVEITLTPGTPPPDPVDNLPAATEWARATLLECGPAVQAALTEVATTLRETPADSRSPFPIPHAIDPPSSDIVSGHVLVGSTRRYSNIDVAEILEDLSTRLTETIASMAPFDAVGLDRDRESFYRQMEAV